MPFTRLIQAVTHYYGTSPTGSNTTDLTDRKQYHIEANPENSWRAGGDPLENPSGKEHSEWDFASYMDILPGAASQIKIWPKEFGYVVLIKISF